MAQRFGSTWIRPQLAKTTNGILSSKVPVIELQMSRPCVIGTNHKKSRSQLNRYRKSLIRHALKLLLCHHQRAPEWKNYHYQPLHPAGLVPCLHNNYCLLSMESRKRGKHKSKPRSQRQRSRSSQPSVFGKSLQRRRLLRRILSKSASRPQRLELQQIQKTQSRCSQC